MTDGHKLARRRLIRPERIGPVTYFQLLNRFVSAEAALSALPDLARRGGGKAPRIATKADAEREMAAVEKAGAKQLFLGLPPYPNLLAELEDAPPVITFRVLTSLRNKPSVAIVGTPTASAPPHRFSRRLAIGGASCRELGCVYV